MLTFDADGERTRHVVAFGEMESDATPVRLQFVTTVVDLADGGSLVAAVECDDAGACEHESSAIDPESVGGPFHELECSDPVVPQSSRGVIRSFWDLEAKAAVGGVAGEPELECVELLE
jgi:hypothetical protein